MDTACSPPAAGCGHGIDIVAGGADQRGRLAAWKAAEHLGGGGEATGAYDPIGM